MINIISQLRDFVRTNATSPNKKELYLDMDGCYITYSYAEAIIEVVDSLQMTTSSLQEKISEYKDYNRLLRKENFEYSQLIKKDNYGGN